MGRNAIIPKRRIRKMRKITEYLVAILSLAALGMASSLDVSTQSLAFGLFLEPGSVHAFAAPPEENMKQREARLIEGAKKEGKFVFWSSGRATELEAVLAKFRQRYPFLKTIIWRAGTTARHQKIRLEARAGAYNFPAQANHRRDKRRRGCQDTEGKSWLASSRHPSFTVYYMPTNHSLLVST